MYIQFVGYMLRGIDKTAKITKSNQSRNTSRNYKSDKWTPDIPEVGSGAEEEKVFLVTGHTRRDKGILKEILKNKFLLQHLRPPWRLGHMKYTSSCLL
jgi:hypothetical protein